MPKIKLIVRVNCGGFNDQEWLVEVSNAANRAQAIATVNKWIERSNFRTNPAYTGFSITPLEDLSKLRITAVD